MDNKLIKEPVVKVLLMFALPYLLSSFLQTFYGMADLYIVGQFNGADSLSAVSIGSQCMHFLTVIIIGMAMGVTITLGHLIGARKYEEISSLLSNALSLFVIVSALIMLVTLLNLENIISIMSTPVEAISQMRSYLKICISGIPFIVGYNVISSIFRGAGDSKTPMIIIAIACVLNVVLDYILVGGFMLQATGAAVATIIAQGISAVIGLVILSTKDLGFKLQFKGLSFDQSIIAVILKAGMPIALQDGLIQVSFLAITVFANSRGLVDASAVGVVEKLIGFFFLVPSAFLSALSAIVSINVGANAYQRAKSILKVALVICCGYGAVIALVCQICPGNFVSLFTNDTRIITAGASYLRSYGVDTFFAGIHFCFSGYFMGLGFSSISFIHNTVSMATVRLPLSYLASIYFTDSLFPMGCAAPLGSFLSDIICIIFFIYLRKKYDYLR